MSKTMSSNARRRQVNASARIRHIAACQIAPRRVRGWPATGAKEVITNMDQTVLAGGKTTKVTRESSDHFAMMAAASTQINGQVKKPRGGCRKVRRHIQRRAKSIIIAVVRSGGAM